MQIKMKKVLKKTSKTQTWLAHTILKIEFKNNLNLFFWERD